MRTINELSQATITARPVDLDGDLVVPTNARYRLDDLDSRRELVAWTSLTAATEMTITIPAASNAIIAVNRKRERKVLTVEIDDGLASGHHSEYIYWVKNLHFAQVT